MSQAEFGEWLAREVNALEDDESHKPVTPYTRQRIHVWESGEIAVPYKIKYVLAARRIAELEADTQKQRPSQKQKP